MARARRRSPCAPTVVWASFGQGAGIPGSHADGSDCLVSIEDCPISNGVAPSMSGIADIGAGLQQHGGDLCAVVDNVHCQRRVTAFHVAAARAALVDIGA